MESTRISPGPPRVGRPPVWASGDPPLSPVLERWMVDLASAPERAFALVEEFGSPLHLHRADVFARNVRHMTEAVRGLGTDVRLFFARKANKAFGYLNVCREAGVGVDVASLQELEESLVAGIPPHRIVLSAAVKPEDLLRRAVDAGVTVVLDNEDEGRRLAEFGQGDGRIVRVALRVSDFGGGERRRGSRFGFAVGETLQAAGRVVGQEGKPGLSLVGLHFHLDGYGAQDRVDALGQTLNLVDSLRAEGHPVEFIDMGGGFPVAYLERLHEWETFLNELDRALLGARSPVTWGNEGFGRLRHGDDLAGQAAVYPHFQSPTGSDWLHEILTSALDGAPGTTVASALRQRGLRLHAEPGRALLDGCGLTLARVEHTKVIPGGLTLVGLSMNGSNCRTKKSELLVDPLVVQRRRGPLSGDQEAALPIRGVLTGAYCTESDVIMSRILALPPGLGHGDLFLFPNTAGYYMHFVESRSHQFPLPLNVWSGVGGQLALDEADL